MDDALALKIRRARKEAGLTREQIAVKMGVSLATVARYESGRTSRISLEMLNNIALATDKPLVWFFEEEAA